jgi:predicted AAA+ superfamily ATPase
LFCGNFGVTRIAGIECSFEKKVSDSLLEIPRNMEVDFIVYGEETFYAIEVTKASRVREGDIAGLKAFLLEYPKATTYLVYGGYERYYEDNIHFIPVIDFFRDTVREIFHVSSF